MIGMTTCIQPHCIVESMLSQLFEELASSGDGDRQKVRNVSTMGSQLSKEAPTPPNSFSLAFTPILDIIFKGLVMLAGEPGIGKTRTARVGAAVYAGTKGVQVLWDWCYEEEGASRCNC